MGGNTHKQMAFQKKEEVTPVEKKEVKQDIMVVEALPTYPVRTMGDKEGNQFNLLTRDEALTEMYKDIKEIKAALR
jgi:hypothetical protein